MANGGRIDFTIGYKVDQTGLAEIKRELAQIQQMTPTDLMNMNKNITSINQARSELGKLQYDVTQIQAAFNNAFDTTTGVTNIVKLNQSLQKLDLSRISKNFNLLGTQGQQAFTKIASQAMTANLKFKETNNTLDKMAKTLGNTLKWSISSKAINTFTGAIQQAWGYVQHLDTSLNDIRIVTGKSAEEMDNFAKKANDAAQSLGAATTDYTEAALIYYQQGLSDEESNARAETTIKAANVTGQSAQQVSEELTAVWNGYKVSAEETELYVDKLAAVAATTAADLEELSTGMSKVASAAANMGVDVDQLNAQLATIVSVTRQAPESVGTALKTIYARIEDLKLGGEDEDGTQLGQVSSGLESMGVEIKDAQGDLRDLGKVIEEIGGKWDSWTESQQAAIAQLVAGKRQYNNLIALFDNWDMYNDALITSQDSIGTLQEQQNIYMESTAAHLQQLKTQWEDLYDSLIDQDDINGLTDLFTGILDKVTNFVDAIGGGKGALLGLGAVATQVFNRQISQGLESIVTKFQNTKSNLAQINAELKTTQLFAQNMGLNPELTNQLVALKRSVQEYYDVMSQEEIQQSNELIKEVTDLAQIKQGLEENIEKAKQFTSVLAAANKETKGTQNRIATVDFTNSNGKTTETVRIMNQQYEKLSETLTTLTTQYQQLQTAVNAYKEAEKNGEKTGDAQKAVNKALREYEETLNRIKDVINASGNQELINEYNTLSATLKKLTADYKAYNTYSTQTPGKKAAMTRAITSDLNAERAALNNVKEGLEEEAKAFQKAYSPEQTEKLANVTKGIQDQETALRGLYTAFDTRQFISGITSIVSGLSSIGMAYTSLSSLARTWSDDTTSTMDKVAQTFISLGMILPAVTTAMQGLNNAKTIYNTLTGAQVVVNGALYGSTTAINTVLALEAGVLNKAEEELVQQGIATSVAAINTEIQSGKLSANTAQLLLNTQAVKANAAAQQALGTSMGTVGSGTQGLIKGFSSLGGKLTSLGSAVGGASSAIGALGAGVVVAGVAVAALAAVIVTCGLAYKNYKERLESAAAASQEAAKQAKENTDALKEQKDVVNEVTDAYKELNEQYDKDHVHELRQATYELCKEHGLQDLAVKALIADYDELNKIMDEAQSKSNEDYGKAIAEEQAQIKDATSKGIAKETKLTEKGADNKIFLKGMNSTIFGISDEEKSLVKDLLSLGINIEQGDKSVSKIEDIDWGKGFAISADNLNEAALNHYDELISILKASGTKASERLLELLESQTESYERNKELLENSKEQIANTYLDDFKNVDSTAEYNKTKQNLLNDEQLRSLFTDASGVLDEDALNTWVQEWLNGIDTIKEYVNNADLGESIYEAFGLDDGDVKAKERIQAQIDELSDVEKNFVQDNIDLLPFYDDVNDFIAHFKDSIENLEQNEIELKINAVFESDKNGAYGEEEIQDLFANTKFEEKSGISQDQFESMNFEQQREVLLNYYTTANQKEQEYRANIEETVRITKEEFERQRGIVAELEKEFGADTLDKATNGYVEYWVNTWKENVAGLGEYTAEEIETALAAFAEGDLNETQQKIIDTLIKSGEEAQNLVKKVGHLSSVQQDYNNATKDFNKTGKKYTDLVASMGDRAEQLNDIEEDSLEITDDWASAHKEAQDALDDISSQIDDIQSAYKSLTSIMEDYNETGTLSMDNLQSLLAMDDEYLAALSFENGQMSLNEESLKQMTLARLDEAQAKVLDETETELLALAEQQAQNASSGVETQTDNTKTAVEECTAALKEGTAAWNDYWNAMKQSTGATGAQADTIIEAGKTRYEAINKVKDQILSGDFSTTMNGTSSNSSSSSSSSSSESESDEKDELKIDDIDLYRGINEELEKMESILGRIQEIDEHSWGASAIKALETEGKLLEDQIEKYEEKRELQEGDLSKKKGELEAEGIQFSEDGSTMTNASEKLKSLYEEYNSMVASYNAMSKTEQDEYEKTLENKKEAIDNLEDAIDDYESLYSDWQDTLDTLLDKQYELIENAVSQFNATVDLHLELDDAEKDWNDFWYDVVKDIDDSGVEDKIESLAEKISKSLSNLTTLVGYGASAAESSVGELTDHLNKTIDEVKKQIATASTGGSGSIFGIDTAKSKETLTDYRDRLIEAVTEAKEAVDDIADTYLDMLDAAQDKIDKQVEGWESINDHLEHNVKLIKLISGENSYDALNKQYERQYENDKNLLNTAKQSQEFWKDQISHYQALMDNTEKGSKQWKTYSKALETATDNYRDSVNKLDKALEDALSNLEEWRKNQENAALETLDRAMSGGLGLDLVEQQWKLIDDHSSKYLDNVEKALSLEQYTNELEKAANEVGLSAENQAKLNKFRDEELSKLNTKAKLTKYDVEESRARLEIMKQEMLLEEQKNNKSNMRLRRDSQGNYSYQYTGNEEDEAEAEEGLLTAKQAWYDLVKSRYKETREWILELEKEQSALAVQIKDAEAAGDVERLNYLKEMYETNAKDISDAYAEAEKNKRDLFDGTAQYFADVENAQILPQSKATVSTLIEQWATGGEQSFVGAVEKAVTDLHEIQQEYLTKQNELLQEAGVNYQDLKNDGIDPTTDSLGDLVDTNEELAEQLEQVNDQLTQQEENLRAAEEAYNSLKDAAVAAIQEANEWLKTLAETAVETVSTVQKAIESAESSASSYASKATASANSDSSGSGNSSGDGSNQGENAKKSASVQRTGVGTWGLKDNSTGQFLEYYYAADTSDGADEARKHFRQNWGSKYSFKTGGYTGDWNDGSGKLAVLHSKELVLNESDTSNILKAVDTIRDLVSSSSSLDLGGIAQSIIQIGSSQAQMLAQVGSGIMSAMSSVVSNSQSYNSNMTVNADFSGVRSAEAIYQALRELENYGSQQAYSNAPHMNKAY